MGEYGEFPSGNMAKFVGEWDLLGKVVSVASCAHEQVSLAGLAGEVSHGSTSQAEEAAEAALQGCGDSGDRGLHCLGKQCACVRWVAPWRGRSPLGKLPRRGTRGRTFVRGALLWWWSQLWRSGLRRWGELIGLVSEDSLIANLGEGAKLRATSFPR